jgi:hypothetical protein
VAARGKQYELRRDQGTMLLDPKDAERAREVLDSVSSPADSPSHRGVVCDRLGAYVALLAAGEEGGEFDTVRILEAKENRPCEGYADQQKMIMSFDLGFYTIRKVAFARNISSADGVPDYLYLQSGERDVIYRLAWKPARIRSMLCDTLLRQNGNRVPPTDTDLPISLDVRAILSKKAEELLSKNVKYAPEKICGD